MNEKFSYQPSQSKICDGFIRYGTRIKAGKQVYPVLGKE